MTNFVRVSEYPSCMSDCADDQPGAFDGLTRRLAAVLEWDETMTHISPFDPELHENTFEAVSDPLRSGDSVATMDEESDG